MRTGEIRRVHNGLGKRQAISKQDYPGIIREGDFIIMQEPGEDTGWTLEVFQKLQGKK